MQKTLISKFTSAWDAKQICNITLADYIESVKNGETQDLVLPGRVQGKIYKDLKRKAKDVIIKNKKKEILTPEEASLLKSYKVEKEKYDKFKKKCRCVTGSCTIRTGERRSKANVDKFNGLIVIDIDEDVDDDLYETLKHDKYSYIAHRSFGGDGICIFVKINKKPEAFLLCFEELQEYYYNTYNVTIDASCKNQDRLRFISYDPDIFINDSAIRFKNVKRKQKPVPVVKDFVFLESDFTEIVNQIVSRRVSICDNYNEYMQIGYAIASEFGWAGFSYFDAIASVSAGYDEKKIERHYMNFCKSDESGAATKATIATVYYYAKEAGIDLYSERTKQIVRTTSISKQGKDTGNTLIGVEDVLELKGIKPTEEEKLLIKHIWNNKNNLLRGVLTGESEMAKLERYVIDTCTPYYDEIKNRIYNGDGSILVDSDINDAYRGASDLFYDDFKVQKSDINAILNSSAVRRYNPIDEFFDVEIDGIKTGYIDKYAKLLPYTNEEQLKYNTWVLKKWLVGAVHNWTSTIKDMEVCPFVMVLTGPMGNGKSTFIRNILPESLRDYFLEERIDGNNKDSKIKLGQYLLLTDEEFGGMASKDVKAFKALADLRLINERQAFRTNAESWKRRAILAGTTNEMAILKDSIGNRRILPINTWVGKINHDGVKAFDTDSLLYEAYKLYKEGFQWRIYTDEQQLYLKNNNEDFEKANPFGDLFFNHFSPNKDNSFKKPSHMKLGEIIEWMNTYTSMKPNEHNIIEMLQKEGIFNTSIVKINGKSKRKYYKLYRKTNSPWKEQDPDIEDTLPF